MVDTTKIKSEIEPAVRNWLKIRIGDDTLEERPMTFPSGGSQVTGISHHYDSSNLEEIVNGVVEEPIQFEYIPVTYEGKECALIHIPLSKSGPHRPKKDYGVLRKYVFYTRRASGNREASMREIREMIFRAEGKTDFVVEDLIHGGFSPDMTSEIVHALSVAQENGNERLSRFLETYLELGKHSPIIHESWRALISGFPIIAEDINAPVLTNIAEIAKKLSPWVSKGIRSEYHKNIKPLFGRIIGEVQAFLLDSAMSGGFPLLIHVEAPDLLWRLGLKTGSKPFRIEDALIKGYWSYSITSTGLEQLQASPLEQTWAGKLFDIISRLPDPDRQAGKVLPKTQLTDLVFNWCATDSNDFSPPLNDIKRTPNESWKGTMIGWYLDYAIK